MFQVRAYEARTVSWWYQRRNDIKLDPSFQRSGKLWSNEDKAYLIDTIINEYDFPKLYLADFSYLGSPLNYSKKKFSVIDGRQRLEAIFDFIEDKFAISENFIFEADLSINLVGYRYSKLRLEYPEIALIFEQFNLPVMSVITDSEAKINQLFVRMNRNKPLTGAEIRNAMKGQVPLTIRRISEHAFFEDKCSFSKNRGQAKNVAAKLLLLSHSNQFVNTKKNDLDTFVKQFEESSAETGALGNANKLTEKVLNSMTKIFNNKDILLKASGLIPVYFKVIEEHGTAEFRNFLAFWHVYADAEPSVLDKIDFIDDSSKSSIHLFNLTKRNPNDAYAMQKLFVILSVMYLRFKNGRFADAVKNSTRLQSQSNAAKKNLKKRTN